MNLFFQGVMAAFVCSLLSFVLLGPTVTLEQGESTFETFFGLLSRGAHLNLYAYGGLPLMSTVLVLFNHLAIMAGAVIMGNRPLLAAGLICWVARAAVPGPPGRADRAGLGIHRNIFCHGLHGPHGLRTFMFRAR